MQKSRSSSSAGKRVLVIGATGALGQAVVAAWKAQDARVALADRSSKGLAMFGPESRELLYGAFDLLDVTAVSSFVQRVVGEWGGFDAVCHIAGGFHMGEAVAETSDDTWDAMMAMNARAFMNVARVVVPSMSAAHAGKIVAVGAWGAQRGLANMGAYAASKRALQALVESLSAEQREHGINVNAVLPSIIDTPANRTAMPGADWSKWIAPADLANVILFLCGDGARAIHGASIPVVGLS
jgi:NAD(P)-dependent dehydrogenase (short-subunit alcohol dehydrogenase family)